MDIPRNRTKRRTKWFSRNECTHVRYDHRHRPTLIEIRCPKCQGLARAVEACEFPCVIHDDMSPHWNEGGAFTVTCTCCALRRKDVRYDQLGTPFHQITVGRTTLWAWNRQHLVTLRQFLAGEKVDEQPYAAFMTYVRRSWLLKRAQLVGAIDEYLAGAPGGSA